jgi:arginine decarboxylase
MAYIVKKAIDSEVSRGKMQPRMGVKLADLYRNCLQGYTYFKP